MGIDVEWLETQFRDLKNLQPLSSGGQKWVFSADHAVDGKVVLKIFKPTSTPHGTELVFREMLAVQEVASPRVPAILEHGDIDTQLGKCFWFREQRIPGSPLTNQIRAGNLKEKDLLRLGLQMLEALATSESQSIVHRDVKPDNIIAGPTGDYWLLDFGLARHLNLVSITATTDHFGKCTPGYAPPEQFRNHKSNIDGRSDLFALGITIYEAATGSNPFRVGARDVHQVLRNVESLSLPPLSLNMNSPEEFQDLIFAMTQKRRDHRPRTVKLALEWMQKICIKENI